MKSDRRNLLKVASAGLVGLGGLLIPQTVMAHFRGRRGYSPEQSCPITSDGYRARPNQYGMYDQHLNDPSGIQVSFPNSVATVYGNGGFFAWGGYNGYVVAGTTTVVNSATLTYLNA
jgi:hypothetical protein